jgi:hypothetical protein
MCGRLDRHSPGAKKSACGAIYAQDGGNRCGCPLDESLESCCRDESLILQRGAVPKKPAHNLADSHQLIVSFLLLLIPPDTGCPYYFVYYHPTLTCVIYHVQTHLHPLRFCRPSPGRAVR